MSKKQQETISEEQKCWINLVRYHSANINAILHKYHQIEDLIGLQHHSPSEGYHCELLLADYLRQIIPGKFSVDTGFIRGNPFKTDKGVIVASPQIDILIHDTHNFSPIYRMDDLVVVVPESVVGVIEVKKKLTSKQLKKALRNIAIATLSLTLYRTSSVSKIFSAVVAFDSDKMGIKSYAYKNRLNAINDKYKYPACLPHQIIDFSHGMYDIGLDAKNHVAKVRCFDAFFSPPNESERLNLSLQFLLHGLMTTTQMLELRSTQANRYAFPTTMMPLEKFEIPFTSSTQQDT